MSGRATPVEGPSTSSSDSRPVIASSSPIRGGDVAKAAVAVVFRRRAGRTRSCRCRPSGRRARPRRCRPPACTASSRSTGSPGRRTGCTGCRGSMDVAPRRPSSSRPAAHLDDAARPVDLDLPRGRGGGLLAADAGHPAVGRGQRALERLDLAHAQQRSGWRSQRAAPGFSACSATVRRGCMRLDGDAVALDEAVARLPSRGTGGRCGARRCGSAAPPARPGAPGRRMPLPGAREHHAARRTAPRPNATELLGAQRGSVLSGQLRIRRLRCSGRRRDSPSGIPLTVAISTAYLSPWNLAVRGLWKAAVSRSQRVRPAAAPGTSPQPRVARRGRHGANPSRPSGTVGLRGTHRSSGTPAARPSHGRGR